MGSSTVLQNGRSNLVKTAYEKIKQAIVSNKLKPGICISGSQLAQYFHMSRTPIREALQLLESEGLVEMKNGAGFYVKSITLEELREINQVRCALECAAVRFSMHQIPEKDLCELIHEWDEIKESPLCNDELFDKIVQLDERTHHLITRHSGNAYLNGLLGSIETKVRQTQYLSLDQHNALITIEQHIHILKATLKKELPLIQQQLEQHFQYAMDYIQSNFQQSLSDSGSGNFFDSVF